MNTSSDTVVEIGQGALRGAKIDTPSGACIGFRSVPYAAPPVGALRFMPPAAPLAWAGERDARATGPVLPQLPSRLANVMGSVDLQQSEGALTVSIWTPSVEGRRPVIVWLHGGAFITGGGDLAWYDGARLAAEQDAVVVAVNYRIGALGFLHFPGVSEGNLGLLDQEAALDWVRENIAAFGGDAAAVTVMGQSAGGISIAHLLNRPGWYARRAVMLSAPMSLAPQSIEVARRNGEAFLQALGIDPSAADARARAQAVPIDAVLQAQAAAARFHASRLAPSDVAPPFVPVGDGRVVGAPDSFADDMARAASRVDVMIGTTRDESTAFVMDNPQIAALPSVPLPGPVAARWRARRPGATIAQVMADQGTWDHFEEATVAFARDAAGSGRRAFLYRFDWAPPGSRYGAVHCIDLPFVFGTAASYGDAPMLRGGDPAGMEALAAQFRAAIGAFAREGDPSRGAGVPAWPPVDADHTWRLRWGEVVELVAEHRPGDRA